MQRIDENTYIDDTLVTCAEYQLFIDEMHKQGKYYQPDHWTANQFIKDQAFEPALGVRFGDALIFCNWLSERNAGDWHYRLLTQTEAIIHPLLLSASQSQIGYWVEKNSSLLEFAWVNRKPVDARGINRILAPNYINTDELDRAVERARNRGLDISFAVDHVDELDFDDNQRAQDHTLNLLRYSNHTRDQAFIDACARSHSDRNAILSNALHHAFEYAFERAFKHIFDLCIDLFTLQERIAGRSPAFEGIRLVKERIR